jgi:hypothetical protein
MTMRRLKQAPKGAQSRAGNRLVRPFLSGWTSGIVESVKTASQDAGIVLYIWNGEAQMAFGMTASLGLACSMLWGTYAFAQNDAEFDETLEHVLRASKERFIPVEGARNENRLREFFFEAKLYLPGATFCRVFQRDKTPIYGCEWEQAAIPNSFAGLYDRLTAKIEAALGSDWNKRPGSRKSGKDVLFTANDRPTVQLILETGAPMIHVFIFPAGSSQKGITTLPDWHTFFHPERPKTR